MVAIVPETIEVRNHIFFLAFFLYVLILIALFFVLCLHRLVV